MQLGNDFYSVQRNTVRITLYRIQYTTVCSLYLTIKPLEVRIKMLTFMQNYWYDFIIS